MGINQGITPDVHPKRAIFLDRDGVLNRNVFYPDFDEWESPRSLADLKIIPEIVAPLHTLQNAGFSLFIVTNQPSYAKGKTSMEDLLAIKHAFGDFFNTHGIAITAEYYCFHHPKGTVAEYTQSCQCRKPSPYFLQEAAKEFHVDLAHSWMIGDRDTDMACGQAAGVRTIRLPADRPTTIPATTIPTYIAMTFEDAVDIITLAISK